MNRKNGTDHDTANAERSDAREESDNETEAARGLRQDHQEGERCQHALTSKVSHRSRKALPAEQTESLLQTVRQHDAAEGETHEQ